MQGIELTYPLYDGEYEIIVGDIVALDTKTDTVYPAILPSKLEKRKPSNIIGICTKVEDENITVLSTGMCDVNTTGIVCIGDKLTPSNLYGKAQALKYEQNITQFKMQTIGKVVGLYRYYNTAKVLLNIE